MSIDFLLEVFREKRNADAIVWNEEIYTYDWLLGRIEDWRAKIAGEELDPGTVVMLEADFSPNSVALFLALTDRRCILVPLTRSMERPFSSSIKRMK
jgi:long-chain acyl-CoA synthetase